MFLETISTRILDWFVPPVCVHCRREGAWLCATATAELRQLRPVQVPVPACPTIAAGRYDHSRVLQQLIQSLKYHYWHGLVPMLEPLLLSVIIQLRDLPPDSIIVPVPLHTHRLRERGFNQSYLIAQRLSPLLGVPIQPAIRRIRATKSQAQLSAHARLLNVHGAFQAVPELTQGAACAILVDDVVTTGSTLDACAAVLRKVGIQKTVAVALAKG